MPISDLTGTVWLFDNTSLLASNYATMYDVSGTINQTKPFNSLYAPLDNFNYGKVLAGNVEEETFWDLIQNANGSWSVYDNDNEEEIEALGNSIEITVTSGTDVTNSTLIAWFEANATQQSSQLSVDLSTLSGWSDVTTGSHTLTIKAKASGYRDSALSAGASFTKAASGYQVRLTGSGDNNGSFSVYDAQSAVPSKLLYNERSLYSGKTFDTTVTCTSGYLYIVGGTLYWTMGTPSSGITLVSSSEVSAVYQVTANGSITGFYCEGCLAKGTLITLADGSQKPIEDITFDDELLVWDFYEGKLTTAKPKYMLPSKKTSYHYETELENGTIIKTVGKYGHRLFDADKNEFIYDTECVDDYVLLENGEKSKVVSCKKVEDETEFFNVITDKHYNLFANGILTSCRLSNRYSVENMKYNTEEKMTEEEVKDYLDKLEFKGFVKQ